ncbi:uncharacterized mitochondrial protein AtMg00860-like [Carya illinoinensis]|uniref:uncharacterized mitochondrial protein AtMg00860-like n=1 Tax=Carya illinoinensis TaxID=32201 RepID=UPI001C7181E8|nr:uncharacterized mitochondrial protein AtMg00860-like [Carya illinoinensis]
MKIEAIVDWPLPKDVLALRDFLGLTGNYWQFVRNFGLIAKPLISLLKKDNFEWTKEAREAFDELKRTMTMTPVLALPNFEKPFEAYTDATTESEESGVEWIVIEIVCVIVDDGTYWLLDFYRLLLLLKFGTVVFDADDVEFKPEDVALPEE